MKPTPAEIQVHDLLLDSNPTAHAADCSICKDRAPASHDVEENHVDTDELQRQIADLRAELAKRDETIDTLRKDAESKDTEEQIATLTSERDDAVKAKDKAEADLDSLRTEFQTYKGDLEKLADAEAEQARIADLAVARRAAVTDLGYTEKFVTDERVARWAAQDDATWDDTLAQLTETKPAASDPSKDVDPTVDPDKVTITDDTSLENEDLSNDKVTDAAGKDFKSLLRNRGAMATAQL